MITGAGSGIGRGCARALAARGASVLVVDIDPEGADATAAANHRGGRTGRVRRGRRRGHRRPGHHVRRRRRAFRWVRSCATRRHRLRRTAVAGHRPGTPGPAGRRQPGRRDPRDAPRRRAARGARRGRDREHCLPRRPSPTRRRARVLRHEGRGRHVHPRLRAPAPDAPDPGQRPPALAGGGSLVGQVGGWVAEGRLGQPGAPGPPRPHPRRRRRGRGADRGGREPARSGPSHRGTARLRHRHADLGHPARCCSSCQANMGLAKL